MYAIHCFHYHEEDIEFADQAEAINHYICYNADTRVMTLYPEVVVLTDADVLDLDTFLDAMSKPPYLLKFHAERPAALHVRQWHVLVNKETLALEHYTDVSAAERAVARLSIYKQHL